MLLLENAKKGRLVTYIDYNLSIKDVSMLESTVSASFSSCTRCLYTYIADPDPDRMHGLIVTFED